MHRRNKKCAGRNVAVAALIGLDRDAAEGEFPHREKLSRVPKKGKMLAGRLLWNPRGADKTLDLPVS